MNLNDLKKEIPYQWRVQSFSKNKAVATCVAYIDARDAMDLLDEVCGPENWQCEYYQVKNTMFCRIGIKVGEEWVWKADCGSETDVEAEKGEGSDSFKRAAVKWGIGRFLYSLPIQYVKTNGPKTEQNRYPHILDDQGNRTYDLTKHLNAKLGNAKAQDTDFYQDIPSIQVDTPVSNAPGACQVCGSTNREKKEGKYGPYWHCGCGKNESIK